MKNLANAMANDPKFKAEHMTKSEAAQFVPQTGGQGIRKPPKGKSVAAGGKKTPKMGKSSGGGY